jgi:hypothetical protein
MFACCINLQHNCTFPAVSFDSSCYHADVRCLMSDSSRRFSVPRMLARRKRVSAVCILPLSNFRSAQHPVALDTAVVAFRRSVVRFVWFRLL